MANCFRIEMNFDEVQEKSVAVATKWNFKHKLQLNTTMFIYELHNF